MQTDTFQAATPQKMQLEIVQAPDGSGAYIDIDLPGYMARANIGQLVQGGYCDTEILDAETGKNVHYQHEEFGSSKELNAILSQFFSTLHALPSPFAHLPTFALLLSE